MDYLDYELEIGSGKGREYPVSVIRSPAGEARVTMRFPFDKLVLDNRLKDLQIALLRSGGRRRKVFSPEEETVQGFGKNLFNALISGEARSRYDVSLREATQQGKGLRLKLRIQSPELAALPWEYLYDERQGEYLSLSRNTPIVRYLELAQPIQPLTVTPPLRILGMIASPRDLSSLDTERERERVEQAIKGLRGEGLVDLNWLRGETWRDLLRAMRGGPWHVFHFIGHGAFDADTDEGLVAFADEEGRKNLLSATQLGRLLADHDPLRLVLLNACEGARAGERDIFSSSASILVRRGIPAVLAMQYEITDRAAIEFSRTFYEAVADGFPVDASIAEARKAVSLAVNNTLEWGTPVLYMRSPDGVLFSLAQKVAATEELSGEAERDTEIHPSTVTEEPVKGLTPKPETRPAAQPMPAAKFIPQRVRLLHTLEGHKNSVNSVAFSPDGSHLASGSGDKTVRLWSVSEGKLLHTLKGHKGRVLGVAFSPDGSTLASWTHFDNTVRLWGVSEGKLLHTLEGYKGSDVAFSPDGSTLASGSRYYTVRLWSVSEGKLLHTLKGHKGGVCSVAFSPNGSTLASGSDFDNTVRLWSVSEGKLLHALEGHKDMLSCVAFSPDGLTLASGSGDNTVRLWSVSEGKLLHTLKGHSGRKYKAVLSVAFSPDGSNLASIGLDYTVRLWSVSEGKLLHTLKGHKDGVDSVAFSPGGSTLASWTHYDNTVRLWSVSEGKLLHTLKKDNRSGFGGSCSVAFSPDWSTLASWIYYENTVRLWGASNGK